MGAWLVSFVIAGTMIVVSTLDPSSNGGGFLGAAILSSFIFGVCIIMIAANNEASKSLEDYVEIIWGEGISLALISLFLLIWVSIQVFDATMVAILPVVILPVIWALIVMLMAAVALLVANDVASKAQCTGQNASHP